MEHYVTPPYMQDKRVQLTKPLYTWVLNAQYDSLLAELNHSYAGFGSIGRYVAPVFPWMGAIRRVMLQMAHAYRKANEYSPEHGICSADCALAIEEVVAAMVHPTAPMECLRIALQAIHRTYEVHLLLTRVEGQWVLWLQNDPDWQPSVEDLLAVRRDGGLG